jgi:hypothetical protein
MTISGNVSYAYVPDDVDVVMPLTLLSLPPTDAGGGCLIFYCLNSWAVNPDSGTSCPKLVT